MSYEQLNKFFAGTRVKLNIDNETLMKFFVVCFDDEHVLLANTRREALYGSGDVYSVNDIIEIGGEY